MSSPLGLKNKAASASHDEVGDHMQAMERVRSSARKTVNRRCDPTPSRTSGSGLRSVALDSVRDISARSIGTHVWCTASVRWLLHGFGALYRSAACAVISAAWETRILLSPRGR
ncbi:hypothetical protein GCM10010272_54190 [Streptomyces lateritius]|nr:hypothetical protein GCM10010272_54190 [Streptomyces lateritius]